MLAHNKEKVSNISEEVFTPLQTETKRTTELGFFQSIRFKSTMLAIAIGTLPVIAIGAIAYVAVLQRLETQLLTDQKIKARSAMDKLQRFASERYGDIQSLANLVATLRNRNVSIAEQQIILEDYRKIYQVYDSIAVTDATGKNLLDAGAMAPRSFKGLEEYEKIIATKKPVFSQPSRPMSSKRYSWFFAAPIFEGGRFTGMVRTRVPSEFTSDLIKEFGSDESNYFFIDKQGEVFLSNKDALIGKSAGEDFPGFTRLREDKKNIALITSDKQKNAIVAGYAPWAAILDLPDVEWSLLIATPESIAFASVDQLRLAIIFGTLVVAVLVSVGALLITNRALKPLLIATNAVQQIGDGNLETRIEISGEDELAILGSNINILAAQLSKLLAEQMQEADRQRQEKETLQNELIQFLAEMEGVTSGDLTVRANLTAGEIGIVADFFNTIVESLREVVTQVKQSANQVNSSVGINETSVRNLSQAALSQSEQIMTTLRSVESMTQNMQEVAKNADQAAVVSRSAADTAVDGGKAIERTVINILNLRETIAGTAKKVKRLGEASQQISKVITLINQIALKTNLLAVNASIEAAKAGEEGRGFAVVAEEVGALAAQSAEATKEIERIVENIQRETSEVVEAMEEGTAQVVEGTHLVENARESLRQIVEVSRTVNDLFEQISLSTTTQSETSQTLRTLMEQIAAVSQQTSISSLEISTSLQETVTIAQKLQFSVETFKV